MDAQYPGSGAGEETMLPPAVMSIVKLGGETYVLAKLDEDVPEGEANVVLTITSLGPTGAGCNGKGNCCKSLVVE